MVDSKSFLICDVAIGLAILIYYLLSMGTFDASYTTGYEDVSTFFLFVNLFGILLHILLAVADFKQNKTFAISLRAGCITYMVGLAAIIMRMGIFSIWFILLFCLGMAAHLIFLLAA